MRDLIKALPLKTKEPGTRRMERELSLQRSQEAIQLGEQPGQILEEILDCLVMREGLLKEYIIHIYL